MALAMPVVWSDRHRLHDPGGEVWVGVRIPGTELPARADAIRTALAGAGARFVAAHEQPDDAVLAVHDGALTAYLESAWREWEAAGLPVEPGQDRGGCSSSSKQAVPKHGVDRQAAFIQCRP